ncbi:MAG: NADH-quinone oxidoreductase subunit NuoK [Planctomycetes bacterium]|nr:NADH-quinone oxidoreductase subunit NuoK [Planctomycetota bacterium]
MFTLSNCIVLSALLFAIGAYGVVARRNILVMLMSVELMLNAGNLALIAFSRYHASIPSSAANGLTGHVFVLMTMVVAAAEVAVGLAILIALFRNRQTVDPGELDLLKG